MNGPFKVPIRNLFCLISYASDIPELPKSWSTIDEDIITLDFIAMRFISEAGRLVKRGLNKDYLSIVEETNRLGGRVQMNESMTMIMENKASLLCEKDEYSRDILLNQVIKITLEKLIKNSLLKDETKASAYLIWKELPEVSKIDLKRELFERIRYTRLNVSYKPVIHLARLLYELRLLSHKGGDWDLFHAELDEAAMNRLFEKFLRGFYKAEQKDYRVWSERMHWQLEGNSDLLPSMLTDISMQHKRSNEKIIMDAKFYKNVFQSFYDNKSFHSHNMYQLFTYLMHQPDSMTVKGVLIYPYNGDEVSEIYKWDEKKSVEVVSLNLDDSWKDIRRCLLERLTC